MTLSKSMRALLWCSFALYCLFLIKLLFLEMRIQYSFSAIWHYMNLIPFKTLYDYAVRVAANSINTDVVVRNLIGNLIAFFPMGCYLPCLFQRLGKIKRFCRTLLGMLVGVELLQLLLRVGTFDIDDILFNFGGAIAGFGIVHIPAVTKLLKKIHIFKSGENFSD